jgi:hypothetical protein
LAIKSGDQPLESSFTDGPVNVFVFH